MAWAWRKTLRDRIEIVNSGNKLMGTSAQGYGATAFGRAAPIAHLPT